MDISTRIAALPHLAMLVLGLALTGCRGGAVQSPGFGGRPQAVGAMPVDDSEGFPALLSRGAAPATMALRIGSRTLQAEPTFDGNELTITLASEWRSYDVGGAGRYVVLHLPEEDAVAVVDLVKGEIAHRVANLPDDVIAVAGLDEFVIILPTAMVIQRYRLSDGKRTRLAPLPGTDLPKRAVLGGSSQGPLLIAGKSAALFDLATLQPLPIPGEVIGGADRYGVVLRGSMDGRTVTSIVAGIGPVGYRRMQIGETTSVAQFSSTSHARRYAQPTADGRLFLLPGYRTYDAGLNDVTTEALAGDTCFAAADPRFFLAVRFAETDGVQLMQIRICSVADRRVIYTARLFPELGLSGNTRSRMSIGDHHNSGEARYVYPSWAGVLAAMHYDRQHILIRKFDLVEAVASAPKPIHVIVSLPPQTARVGQQFEYLPRSLGNALPAKYRLASGPPGMRLTRGMLRWQPEAAPETPVRVVLTGVDDAGTEALQSFTLAVE